MAKDDEDKPVKTNAAPVLKPPGLGQSGVAPPGSVGTGKPWVQEVFIGGFGQNPFEGGRMDVPTTGEQTPETANPDQLRFHETGDREVDQHYAQDHIMVPDEKLQRDAVMDKFHEPEEPSDHSSDERMDRFHAPDRDEGMQNQTEHSNENEKDIRPQLWEDINRDDDHGPDR